MITRAEGFCGNWEGECVAKCAGISSGCVEFASYVSMATTPLGIALFTLSGVYLIQTGKRGVQLVRKIASCCLGREKVGKMKVAGKSIKVTKTLAKASVALIAGGILFLSPSILKSAVCPEVITFCGSVCEEMAGFCGAIASSVNSTLFQFTQA